MLTSQQQIDFPVRKSPRHGRNSSDVSFKHRKYEKVIDVLSNEKLHFSSSKPIEPKKFCDDGLTCRTPTKRKSNLDILSTPPKSPHRCLRTPMKLLEQPTQKSNKHIAEYASSVFASPPKTPYQAKNRLICGALSENDSLIPLPCNTCRPTKRSQQNEDGYTYTAENRPVLEFKKPDYQCYLNVKQSLHTSTPIHVVGRGVEESDVTEFLKGHLDKCSAGSLYISGAPGTGKTAAILHIIDDLKSIYKCQIVYINCMVLRDAKCVFEKLQKELAGIRGSVKQKVSAKVIQQQITTNKRSMVLVLDEIDQLDSKNQDILYRIFEWPYLDQSKLILVGIANALDLTDRILPRLQARPRCRPKLVNFTPYTKDQIADILNDRLQHVGQSVVEGSAVQFCARKVSAIAGDARKALDICRRAVELVECEARSVAVLKESDCNSPSKSPSGSVKTQKKVTVSHIARVLSDVYDSGVQSQCDSGLPLQQKVVICTLLLIVRAVVFKEVLLGKLYDTYCKVCRKRLFTPVDQSEFNSLCSLLEARGIIQMRRAKEPRLNKVTLQQNEQEVESTLQDCVLVSAILKEGIPR